MSLNFFLPCLALLAALPSQASDQAIINFLVKDRISARALTSGQEVDVWIYDKDTTAHQKIEIDSAQKLELAVGDYDFDGFRDLSISYLDEGKGIFLVSKVYTYSTKNRAFVERQPQCGDEFLNLKINGRKKILTSTYFSNNEPKLCSTKLQSLAATKT